MRSSWKSVLAVAPLVLSIAACGEAESKAAPVTKSAYVAPASAKGGAAVGAARRAQVFTAVNMDVAAKTVDRIEVGQRRTGTLAGSDPTLDDGSHVDLWEIRLAERADVRVDLTTSDFDAFLHLLEGAPAAGGGSLAMDDDSGEGTNSQVSAILEPGTYTIVVNSLGAGETGSYQLSVTGAAAQANDGRAVQGRIEPGSTVSGRLSASSPALDDGSHYQLWQFTGQAGQQVTIELRSDDFDAYLILADGMTPDVQIAQDDDGAGGLNSRVTATLPTSGTYSIVVNTLGSGEVGAYEVELSGAPRDWAQIYPGGGDPSGKYAVVVGIDEYPGTSNDLRGPVDDATLTRDVLVERFGFPAANIVFLRDTEATRVGIANAVVRHLGQAGPSGTAVLFYSGHGTRLEENLGLTGATDPESENGVDEALAVHDGLILDEELGFLLQQIQARNTLVVIDACFSGTSTRAGPNAMAKFIAPENADGLRTPSKFITADLSGDFGFGANAEAFTRVMSNPDRHVLMAASSEDQLSWAIGAWPDRDGPASLFTYYWAKVMRNAPTSTTFQQVSAMVADSVNRFVRQNQSVDEQTVQILGPQQGATIGGFLGSN